jgi:hypothetical protein
MISGKKKPLTFDEWSALGSPAFTNVPAGLLAGIPNA